MDLDLEGSGAKPMGMRNGLIISAAVAFAVAASGSADAKGREDPSSYQALMNCRTITNSAERLACYDAKAAALDGAEKAGDVVIADREQLRETSKGLFGFGALKLPIIGTRSNLETPDQIEAKIAGARSLGYGKWEIALDNNMRWRTTEPVPSDPRIGDPVVIRAGAFTSFFIRVRGARGVRGLRVE